MPSPLKFITPKVCNALGNALGDALGDALGNALGHPCLIYFFNNSIPLSLIDLIPVGESIPPM